MGIFSHIFAGAGAGGFKAYGEVIDDRVKERQAQEGLLAKEGSSIRVAEKAQSLSDASTAATEGRKDYAIGEDGQTVLTRAEYQALAPEDRSKFVPATVAEARAAAAKLAVDERKVSAMEKKADAALEAATRKGGGDSKVVREVVDGVIYERDSSGKWNEVGGKGKMGALPAKVQSDMWEGALLQAKDEASAKAGLLSSDKTDFPGGKTAWINDRAMEIFATRSSGPAKNQPAPSGAPATEEKFADILAQAQGAPKVGPRKEGLLATQRPATTETTRPSQPSTLSASDQLAAERNANKQKAPPLPVPNKNLSGLDANNARVVKEAEETKSRVAKERETSKTSKATAEIERLSEIAPSLAAKAARGTLNTGKEQADYKRAVELGLIKPPSRR
jgi:hypothetical protein